MRLTSKTAGGTTTHGGDAVSIDFDVPAGSVNGASGSSGFTAYETFCRKTETATPRACIGRRANVIRLKPATLKQPAAIILSFTQPIPEHFRAHITVRTSDGRVQRESLDLQIQNRGE